MVVIISANITNSLLFHALALSSNESSVNQTSSLVDSSINVNALTGNTTDNYFASCINMLMSLIEIY